MVWRGWEEQESLGGAAGQSWKDSRRAVPGPAPLPCPTSQPGLLCSKSPLLWSVGVLPREASPAPAVLAQRMLLEHPSRSKPCTILFTPPFIPFAFLFSHIPPRICAQLKPHHVPASPWGYPSQFRRRSRSSKHPRPQGLPQAQPPQETPALGGAPSQRHIQGGQCPCPELWGHSRAQELFPASPQGFPGGEAPQPPLKDSAEVTPAPPHRQEVRAGTQGGAAGWQSRSSRVLAQGLSSPSTLEAQTLWDGKDILIFSPVPHSAAPPVL